MKVKLRFTNAFETKDHVLSVGEVIAVGRSNKCDFFIEDERMSSKHCRFNLSYDRLEIIDLDSKNGTYLNGIRIEASEVFLGDKIRIGKTLVTIDGPDADTDANRVLTFGGEAKDRLKYELKADFTGARIANQNADSHLSLSPEFAYHSREVEIRKRAQSKIRVSKHEIRLKNKGQASLAFVIDMTGIFIAFLLPIIALSKLGLKDLILPVEASVLLLYFFINFKYSKFTVGESMAGIRKLYLNQ